MQVVSLNQYLRIISKGKRYIKHVYPFTISRKQKSYYKNYNPVQYFRHIRRLWTYPSIKNDRAFITRRYKRGYYRYKVRSFVIPRSVNGGKLKITLVRGLRGWNK